MLRRLWAEERTRPLARRERRGAVHLHRRLGHDPVLEETFHSCRAPIDELEAHTAVPEAPGVVIRSAIRDRCYTQ